MFVNKHWHTPKITVSKALCCRTSWPFLLLCSFCKIMELSLSLLAALRSLRCTKKLQRYQGIKRYWLSYAAALVLPLMTWSSWHVWNVT